MTGDVKIFCGIVFLVLTGCIESKSNPAGIPDTINLAINGLNYTNRNVSNFYIEQVWGGNVSAYGGGGNAVCCAQIPLDWSPKFKLKVTWHYSDSRQKEYTAFVAMPRYEKDQIGDLLVAFLPEEKVEVFTTMREITDPLYPGTIRVPPDEYKAQAAGNGSLLNAR